MFESIPMVTPWALATLALAYMGWRWLA